MLSNTAGQGPREDFKTGKATNNMIKMWNFPYYRGDCIKSLGWFNYLTLLVPSTETSHKKSYYHPHHLSNLGILSLLITKVGT